MSYWRPVMADDGGLVLAWRSKQELADGESVDVDCRCQVRAGADEYALQLAEKLSRLPVTGTVVVARAGTVVAIYEWGSRIWGA
jgi:hypothetical protein